MTEITHQPSRSGPRWVPVAITILASTAGLAGTDLLLPGIPALATALPGSNADAQLVIASYVAGMGVGLILLGELGARYSIRNVLPAALLLFAATSLIALQVETLRQLVAVRFAQGIFGAAGAVFAPSVIAEVFPRERAVSAMGMLGAFESLIPGFAPIAGLAIIMAFGWQGTFSILGAAALSLGLAAALGWQLMPGRREHHDGAGYSKLARKPRFMGLASTHALSLSALLSVVFAAPASLSIMTQYGGRWFLAMQAIGVSTFFVVSMLAGRISGRFGLAPTVRAGSQLMLVASLAIVTLDLLDVRAGWAYIAAFVPLNAGFGLRGPTGFYAALAEAATDTSRASAVILVMSLLGAALAAAIAAPFIDSGFFAPALISSCLMLTVAAMNRRLLT